MDYIGQEDHGHGDHGMISRSQTRYFACSLQGEGLTGFKDDHGAFPEPKTMADFVKTEYKW